MNYELFAQFGLAGIILAINFIILKWMMKLHDKVMDDSGAERVKWQEVIEKLTNRIEEGTRSAMSFREQMLEMGRREREEHAMMLKGIEELKLIKH